MIQLRWLWTGKLNDPQRLQFRYRLGGVMVARAPEGSGLRMADDEGWSSWEFVPVVRDETPAPAQLPPPEIKEEEQGK